MRRGRPSDDDDDDSDDDEEEGEGDDGDGEYDGRANDGDTPDPEQAAQQARKQKQESPIVLFARHCNMLSSYIRRGPVNHPRVCIGRELLPKLRNDLHVWVKLAHAMGAHPSDMRILRRPGVQGHPAPKDQVVTLAKSSELLERELAWWHDKGNAELVSPDNKADIEQALSDYWKHRAKLKVMEVVNKRRKARQQQQKARYCKRKRDLVPPLDTGDDGPPTQGRSTAYTDVD